MVIYIYHHTAYLKFIVSIKEKTCPKVLEHHFLVIIGQPRNKVITINKPTIPDMMSLKFLSQIICICFIPKSWLPKGVDPFQPLQQQCLIVQTQYRPKEDSKCSSHTMPCHYKLCFVIFTQIFP